jgi:peroxiredoxin
LLLAGLLGGAGAGVVTVPEVGEPAPDFTLPPFPLLSDFPELKVIRRYGFASPSQTYAQRAFLLIDQQGIIRQRWLTG